jgi:hypothetical protein
MASDSSNRSSPTPRQQSSRCHDPPTMEVHGQEWIVENPTRRLTDISHILMKLERAHSEDSP